MKRIFQIVTLGSLLTMSCFLRAEEVEIQLMNVVRTSNMKVRDILSTLDEDSAFIHTTQKILRGDKLIIIKDGKEYTVDGQLLQ